MVTFGFLWMYLCYSNETGMDVSLGLSRPSVNVSININRYTLTD